MEEKSQLRITGGMLFIILAFAVFALAESGNESASHATVSLDANQTANSTAVPEEPVETAPQNSSIDNSSEQSSDLEAPLTEPEAPQTESLLIASDRVPQEVIDAVAEEGFADVIVALKVKKTAAPASLMAGEMKSLKEARAESLAKLKSAVGKVQDDVLDGLVLAGDKAGLSALSDGFDFRLGHKYLTVGAISGRVTRSGLEKLAESPLVESVAIDGQFEAILDYSIPLIKADEVWNVQVGGENINGTGQTVCVIDTGVDYNHAYFGSGWGKTVIGGHRYVQYESGDDNVDQDCSINNSACYDNHGHGTHVAGIVASQNSIYKGVAPGAKIIIVKALNSTGDGTFSDVEAGIDWCTDNALNFNISVISMSLGDNSQHATHCDSSQPELSTFVNTAVSQGIAITVASGNNGYLNGISLPACLQNVISVGDVYSANFGGLIWSVCTDTTTSADKIVCHCNRGDILSILAPGAVITSSWPGGGTLDLGGTSMATPHVAGAIALISQYTDLNGVTLTPQQISDLLIESGDNIGYDWPRLNVFAAINALDLNCSNPDPQNSLDCTGKTITYARDTTLNVSANFTNCTITAENITVGPNGAVIYDNVSLNVKNFIVEAGGSVVFRNGGNTVWQNGDVTVSGNLTYNHETVRMNISSNDEFGINVLAGGNLTIANGSNMTNGEDADSGYYFSVYGNLSLEDSDVGHLTTGGVHLQAGSALNGLGNVTFHDCSLMAVFPEIDITLTGDLSADNTSIMLMPSSGVSVDCGLFGVEGDDADNSRGIQLTNVGNVTVTDCIVTGWYSGINLQNATNSTIENNTAAYNLEGISLTASSDENRIRLNNASDNDDYGIIVYMSSDNTLANNTINRNGGDGVYITQLSTSGNVISNNTICFNSPDNGSHYDIADYDSSSGDDNTCDWVYNWADDGVPAGCDHTCQSVDFTIEKTSSNDTPAEDYEFTYTILINNSGTGLYNVNLTDALNESCVSFVSSSAANSTPSLWYISNISPGGTYELNITVLAIDTCTGLNNTAYLSAYADGVANTADNSLVLDITDIIPPEIDWTWGTNTTSSDASVNVTLTANENLSACWVGINGTNSSMTGENSTSYYYGWSVPADGNYTLTAYCNDTFNNTGGSEAAWYELDTTPPAINWTWDDANLTTSYSTTNVTLTTDEGALGCNLTVNGSVHQMSGSGMLWWQNLTDFADGNYSLYANCTDAVHNLGNSTGAWWRVDTVSPDLIINASSITLSPDDPYSGDAVTISVEVYNDGSTNATNATVRFLLDDSYVSNSSINVTGGSSNATNFTWTAVSGAHSITMVAVYNESEVVDYNNNYTLSVTVAYCGDGTCNGGESCSSCTGDCGSCNGRRRGGGGGGGGVSGGGSVINVARVLENAALPGTQNESPGSNASATPGLQALVEGLMYDGKNFVVIVIDYNSNPVEGATVSYGGQTVITGPDGKATLTAVMDAGTVDITKEGYLGTTKEVAVSPAPKSQVLPAAVVATVSKKSQSPETSIWLMLVAIAISVLLVCLALRRRKRWVPSIGVMESQEYPL